MFNAAIAHCLSLRSDRAQDILEQAAGFLAGEIGWQVEAHSDALSLIKMMQDAETFRTSMAVRVRKATELQKLPPLSKIDFSNC